MSQQPADNLFSDAEIISAYSRAEALADGALVDCTSYARQGGVKFPTALTQAAYGQCIRWDNETEPVYQDESGRAADVFTMFVLAARRSPGALLYFSVMAVPRGGQGAQRMRLKAIIGPGDTLEPVITIMLPHED